MEKRIGARQRISPGGQTSRTPGGACPELSPRRVPSSSTPAIRVPGPAP